MSLIKKYFITLFIIITFWNFTQAQEIQKIDDVIENLVEHLTENEDETQDVNELFEKLIALNENPININSATDDELKKLPFLNDFQIYSLKEYKNQYGDFLSIYELPMVFGFSEEFVKLIEPFITVFPSNDGEKKKINSRLKHEIIVRSQRIVQEQVGYSKQEGSRYIGSPYKIYTRYKAKQEGRFSAGITAEKDPGEHIFNDTLRNQVDFYSAYVSLEKVGIAEQIIVGDFNASFGQGLVLWTGFSSGKSSYATSINRYATKLTPYTSTLENQFFRGMGTTLRLNKNIRASIFFSHKKIDGNIQEVDSTISERPIFSSFQTSGYHNTNSLLEDKDAVTENMVGFNLETILKSGKIGITIFSHNFSSYYLKDDNPYNSLHFQGDGYQVGSLYYRFNNKKIVLFGENAITNSKNFALLNGVDYFVHPQLSLSFLHRHFEPGYFSLYSNAFSESGKTQNENGTYLGIKFYPLARITINSYFDMYRFPWLRYQVDAPSEGREFFSEISYSISEKTTLAFRYKNETKKKNIYSASDSKTSMLAEEMLHKLRVNFDFSPTKYIGLRSRVELSKYSLSTDKETGILLYQDIHFQPEKKALAAQLRFAYFDTDGYNSRIYAYENDLLYTFNIPAYFYKGIRFYVNLRYKLSKNVSFYMKFSQSNFINSETTGSGLNEIEGNKKTEIKAQFRLKF